VNSGAQRGRVGWTQLETAAGNRNSLLAASTSILNEALQGIYPCFSPKHQPFSPHNLVALKRAVLGMFLWFLNLEKFIIICKNCGEKIGNHFVLRSIVKVVWLKITRRSTQHVLCVGSKS